MCKASHIAEMIDEDDIVKLLSHLSVLESIGDKPEVRIRGLDPEAVGGLSINTLPGAGEGAFSDATQDWERPVSLCSLESSMAPSISSALLPS